MADVRRENASPTLLVCPLSVIRLFAVLSTKTWASQVAPVVKNACQVRRHQKHRFDP